MNEEAGVCHLIHELQPNVDPAHLAAADPSPVADVLELELRGERVDGLRQTEPSGEEEHRREDILLREEADAWDVCWVTVRAVREGDERSHCAYLPQSLPNHSPPLCGTK